MTTTQAPASKPRRGGWPLWIWFAPVLAGVLIFAAQAFVVQVFRTPSSSMQPSLLVGDNFVVAKWSYGFSRFSIAPFEGLAPRGRLFYREPRRGDIAVFRTPRDERTSFVKRIIGLPGDHIRMVGGLLYINGRAVARQSLGVVSFRDGATGALTPVHEYRETLPNGVSFVTMDRGETELDTMGEHVVAPASYFMLGDDRDNSLDSRTPSMMGDIPCDYLLGRVTAILGQ
jgi:signal peptidase I